MTTPFLETPVFPDDLSFWAQGGVNYNTVVVSSTSGREGRSSLWQYARAQWDLQNVDRANVFPAAYSIQTLRNFFRVCKGQAYGFRFRDWTDYLDEGNGIFGTPLPSYSTAFTPSGAGNGAPTYQMYKQYIAAPLADYRVVQKPRSGTTAVFRNGTAVSAGGSPGNYSLDTTTGLVTFVADSFEAITAWTAVTPNVAFTVSSVPSNWAIGKSLYFTGVSGTGAPSVNNLPLVIANISGTTIVLSIGLSGLTLGGGVASLYPQNTDALTWTGSFDTPCRFATDSFAPQFDGEGMYNFQSLAVVEIRL